MLAFRAIIFSANEDISYQAEWHCVECLVERGDFRKIYNRRSFDSLDYKEIERRRFRCSWYRRHWRARIPSLSNA